MNDFSDEEKENWKKALSKAKDAEKEAESDPWLPGLHYHEKTKLYVDGIRPGEDCFVCDGQWPLVEKAIRSENFKTTILCVTFSEESLRRIKIRKEIGLDLIPDYRYWNEVKETLYEPIPELVDPSKEDRVRWKKQFAGRISKDLIKESVRDITPEEEEKMNEIPPTGIVQKGIFGDYTVIDETKKRRKR